LTYRSRHRIVKCVSNDSILEIIETTSRVKHVPKPKPSAHQHNNHETNEQWNTIQFLLSSPTLSIIFAQNYFTCVLSIVYHSRSIIYLQQLQGFPWATILLLLYQWYIIYVLFLN